MSEVPLIDNIISIVQKCRKKKALEIAKRVHEHICNNGLESHRVVGNHIVPMFVECGSVSDAQQVFDRLVHRNEHSWTSLMLGYIECGQSQHALDLYQKMQHDSVHPSSYTLIALLKACVRLRDVESGRDIHNEIARGGFEGDIFVGNSLVDMYAKCGSLAEAQDVFDNLPVRTVVSWNALMAGYAQCGPGQEALNCLEQMQLEGLSPDAVTLISALKACASIKAVDKGRKIHAVIAQKRHEGNDFVGNTVVGMYAKCGLFSEAWEVFEKLPVRDVVSWNALIAGYAENGPCEEALECFEQMQHEGISPDAVTFVCALKACGGIGAIDKGREVHTDITQKELERHYSVGNTLVDMYAKCGSLADAQEVFDNLPNRNVVSWNALIAGYAEHGPGQEALKYFEQMQLEGISPDSVTFVCTLKACGSIGAIEKGREIYANMIHKGLERDVLIGNTLVDMYAKCGSLGEAWEVFDNLLVRDIVSWNALIAGCAEHGHGEDVLKCFEQMQLEGHSPTDITFVRVLKACGSIAAIDKGREIHGDVTQNGFHRDVFVGNALVDMYAKCDSLVEAQEVFDKLPVRDAVSWNSLIAGYAEHGPGQEALKCFEQMRVEGIPPDAVTYVCALKACGSIGAIETGREIHTDIEQNGFQNNVFVGNTLVDMYARCGSLAEAWKFFYKLPIRDVVSWTALIAGYVEHGLSLEALKCFEQMQGEGVSPNAVTFVCVLKACGSIGEIEKGREIHADIIEKGLGGDVFVCNTLVDMYAKYGLLAEACELFDKLPVRDVVSWNALIAGYAEHGPCQEVLNYFEQMQLEGISPTAVTFVCILKACGSLGAIDKGHEIHAYIAEREFEREVHVGNTLVDMYAKCGAIADARDIFDNLSDRDVVSWTAMIEAYSMNHEGTMAVECFEQMQEQGVEPDEVTFTCLLTACSRASLVVKGQEFFKMMRDEYGIVPTVDHYTCMILLLAESGRLYEAHNFVENMPCPPTWTAMLTACKSHGEAELGLRCFQQLVQINPECAAPYVLMAKIYASAGRLDDAYRIEELRKLAGAKKMPASALIEVNKNVHEFVVGNNESKEMSALLDFLSLRMKQDGHVPNVNMVLRSISDEGKEASLCEHAEKLAIAFGLLNTPQGQTLRVSKNLRMCNDCHNTVKIISRIERREIIVREVYHIHHFKDGSCSCNDMY